jgi:tryptophan-rich sensory protein
MLSLPSITFKIVWPILYLFLLISIILYTLEPGHSKKLFIWTCIVFWIGIVLNILWTFLWFKLENYTFALADLIVLILLAITTLVLFYFSTSSFRWIFTILYLIYTLWLCFALAIFVM